MAKFLVIHTGYNSLEIGLFDNEKSLDYRIEDNKKVTKNILNILTDILKKNKLTLNDLSFISAHQGPAPFTTLRVSLATVNGISFAKKIPLIGINGLTTLTELHHSEDSITIALLNAFAFDLYYGIKTSKKEDVLTGYAPAMHLLEKISQTYNEKLLFLGHGTKMYEKEIKEIFGDRAIIAKDLPNLASIEIIALKSLEKWKVQNTSNELQPIYLKESSPKTVLQINL